MSKKYPKIEIRIKAEEKKRWKEFCYQEGITLTDLIYNSVKNRMNNIDRRRVLRFLEKQNNIYAKVENNINQLARIANGQKFLLPSQQQQFLDYLKEIEELKKKEVAITESIYKFMAEDDSKNFKFGE